MSKQSQEDRYWQKNIKLVSILMVVWFFVSFVLGVFGVEWLNQFKVGGFPVGFWFAQQGSIFIFILLVLIYALMMDRLDRSLEETKPNTEEDSKE